VKKPTLLVRTGFRTQITGCAIRDVLLALMFVIIATTITASKTPRRSSIKPLGVNITRSSFHVSRYTNFAALFAFIATNTAAAYLTKITAIEALAAISWINIGFNAFILAANLATTSVNTGITRIFLGASVCTISAIIVIVKKVYTMVSSVIAGGNAVTNGTTFFTITTKPSFEFRIPLIWIPHFAGFRLTKEWDKTERVIARNYVNRNVTGNNCGVIDRWHGRSSRNSDLLCNRICIVRPNEFQSSVLISIALKIAFVIIASASTRIPRQRTTL